ncbi:uncharacterized protein LOC132368110 [Balaenoptera ricei]|uniref:uncharacterized protein LOC132368110 n=1 Tax=Balaenoptera ricei TaxID=2746895 RepID=UPI0028BDBB12|nr:uncharacterized protein LOC132368110 [Balaenoptera ricei]
MSQNHSEPKLPSSAFCFPKLAGAPLHLNKKLRVEEYCELASSSLLPGAANVCSLPGSLGLSLQTSSDRAHCRSGEGLGHVGTEGSKDPTWSSRRSQSGEVKRWQVTPRPHCSERHASPVGTSVGQVSAGQSARQSARGEGSPRPSGPGEGDTVASPPGTASTAFELPSWRGWRLPRRLKKGPRDWGGEPEVGRRGLRLRPATPGLLPGTHIGIPEGPPRPPRQPWLPRGSWHSSCHLTLAGAARAALFLPEGGTGGREEESRGLPSSGSERSGCRPGSSPQPPTPSL